jgi:hypothetical protein
MCNSSSLLTCWFPEYNTLVGMVGQISSTLPIIVPNREAGFLHTEGFVPHELDK